MLIFSDSLLDSAEKLISKEYPELSVQFTSPYPVGTYKIGFGKEYRATSGLDGYQGLPFLRFINIRIVRLVFILHGYVQNEFDLVYGDQWKTDDELELLKKSSNHIRKPIYREICAVN